MFNKIKSFFKSLLTAKGFIYFTPKLSAVVLFSLAMFGFSAIASGVNMKIVGLVAYYATATLVSLVIAGTVYLILNAIIKVSDGK